MINKLSHHPYLQVWNPVPLVNTGMRRGTPRSSRARQDPDDDTSEEEVIPLQNLNFKLLVIQIVWVSPDFGLLASPSPWQSYTEP